MVKRIARLRALLSMLMLVGGPLAAVAPVISAVAGVAGALRKPPKPPAPPKPPPVRAAPTRAPEAAPVQEQEETATSRQRARRAQAQARQIGPPQTVLTSALGARQRPQNVRQPILG
jgi:hypothetical protein